MKATELVARISAYIKQRGDFEVAFPFGSESELLVYDDFCFGIPPKGSVDMDENSRLLVADPDSEVIGNIRMKPVNVH